MSVNGQIMDNSMTLGKDMIKWIREEDYLPDQSTRAPWLKNVPAILVSGDFYLAESVIQDPLLCHMSGHIFASVKIDDVPEQYNKQRIAFDSFVAKALGVADPKLPPRD